MNTEHLNEALRRLRKNSSSDNVDRRLVTNILLSFLSTSRGDTKRFEMLNILSTILTWDDSDREKAGLQRHAQGKDARPKPGRKASGKEEGRSVEEEAALNEVSSAARRDRTWVFRNLLFSHSRTSLSSSCSRKHRRANRGAPKWAPIPHHALNHLSRRIDHSRPCPSHRSHHHIPAPPRPMPENGHSRVMKALMASSVRLSSVRAEQSWGERAVT